MVFPKKGEVLFALIVAMTQDSLIIPNPTKPNQTNPNQTKPGEDSDTDI